MSRGARLVALRLQGFKSFAERTVVEFAPGINAVVGPNGSGKSNLADALRWTLGEQGRHFVCGERVAGLHGGFAGHHVQAPVDEQFFR